MKVGMTEQNNRENGHSWVYNWAYSTVRYRTILPRCVWTSSAMEAHYKVFLRGLTAVNRCENQHVSLTHSRNFLNFCENKNERLYDDGCFSLICLSLIQPRIMPLIKKCCEAILSPGTFTRFVKKLSPYLIDWRAEYCELKLEEKNETS